MISIRISDISCESNNFNNKAAPDYNVALKKRSFNKKITYSPSQPRHKN